MRTFYHLLANTVISSITNFTVWFTITFFVWLQTESVFATSLIAGIYLIVTAVSGFWLGSLVDNYKKKSVMLGSSILSLLAFLFSFLIYISTPPEAFTSVSSPILWIFVPIIMLGVIAGNIRGIALTTLITILISEKKRDKANGLAGTAFGISFLVTSVISGFLVAHSGMYLVLILASATTLLTIIHLFFINVPEKEVVYKGLGIFKNIDISGTLKAIGAVPGLFALIFFTMFNNFLGGVFMPLMDAYGLSMVSVELWGVMWGVLSCAFIVGGIIITKKGLGKSPLRSLFLANIVIWTVSIFFTIQPYILLLIVGMFIYLAVVPYIEASEHTIIQKVVPPERQGRVFGFAQSVEQSASPLTAFAIGPITQFIFIPFMTDGAGAQLIGSWFGTGTARGIALVFTLTGVIGLIVTIIAMKSKSYKLLSKAYSK